MTARPLRLSAPWAAVLEPVLRSPELQALAAHLRKRKAAGIPVYPPGKDIFAALDAAPPEQVRVVIVGQDPYHGPGQAHGLAFSVAPGVPVPPSLQNIYKELTTDLALPEDSFRDGDLRGWARQGVLLLNAVLTVEQGAPGLIRSWVGRRSRTRLLPICPSATSTSSSCFGVATPSARGSD